MFWQIAILLLVILTIDTLIKNRTWPQVRYALWLMLVVKLILPPSFAMSTSLTSGIQPVINDKIEIKAPEIIKAASEPEYVETKQPRFTAPAAVIISTSTESSKEDILPKKIEAAPLPKILWQSWLMISWLAGIAAMSVLLIGRVRKLKKYNTGNIELPENIVKIVNECRARLKLDRNIKVIVSKYGVSPFVYGIIRPTVVLPADSLTEITEADIRHHLLHELAHIKRGDLLVHGCYVIIQLLYWFNPLVWIIGRQVRHLREICCDSAVAAVLREETREYRQTLLETARRLLAEPVEPTMGLLGLFEDSSKLLARLQWLEKPTWKTRKLQYVSAITAGVIMVCCVLPMAQGKDNSQKESTKQAAPAQGAIFTTIAEEFYKASLAKNVGELKQICGDSYDKVSIAIDIFQIMDSFGDAPEWMGVSLYMWDDNNAVIISNPFTYAKEHGEQKLVCMEFVHKDKWQVCGFDTPSYNKGQQRISSLLQKYGVLQNVWPESSRDLMVKYDIENSKINKRLFSRYLQELNIYSDHFEKAVSSVNWQEAEFCMGEILRKEKIAIELADERVRPVLMEFMEHQERIARLLETKDATAIKQEMNIPYKNDDTTLMQLIGNDESIKDSTEYMIGSNKLQWKNVSRPGQIGFDHGGSMLSNNVQWFGLERYGRKNLLCLVTVKHPFPIDKCRIVAIANDGRKILATEKATSFEDDYYTQKYIVELPAGEINDLVFQRVQEPAYTGDDAELLLYLQELHDMDTLSQLKNEVNILYKKLERAVDYYANDRAKLEDAIFRIKGDQQITQPPLLERTSNTLLAGDMKTVFELVDQADEKIKTGDIKESIKILTDIKDSYLKPMLENMETVSKNNPSHALKLKDTYLKGAYYIVSKNVIMYDPHDGNIVANACRNAIYELGESVGEGVITYKDQNNDHTGYKSYIEGKGKNGEKLKCEFIILGDQPSTLSITCEMEDKDALLKTIIKELIKTKLSKWIESIEVSILDKNLAKYQTRNIKADQSVLDYFLGLRSTELDDYNTVLGGCEQLTNSAYGTACQYNPQNNKNLGQSIASARDDIRQLQKKHPTAVLENSYKSINSKLNIAEGQIKESNYPEIIKQLQLAKEDIAYIQSHITRVYGNKPGLPFFPETTLKGHYKMIGAELMTFDTNDFSLISLLCSQAVKIVSYYDGDLQEGTTYPGYSLGTNTSTGENGIMNGMQSYFAGNDKYGNQYRCEMIIISGQPITLTLKDNSGDYRLLNEMLNQLGYTYLTAMPEKQTTQPQPQTPEDKQKIFYSVFMSAGNMCMSIMNAIQTDDWDSAERLAEKVVKLSEETMPKLKDDPTEPIFKSLMAQFELLHKAIKDKDKAKATLLFETLNEMGGNVSDLLEPK